MPKKSNRKNVNKISIEDQYQKMSQHEHILKIPDTYIGSVEQDVSPMWIFSDKKQRLVFKNIKYVPGFYKIFDEIVVNACDRTVVDKTCRTIRINIDQETGEISCYNDGDDCIPVARHKEHKIFVPEMIFGVLLTSGNYNQTGKIVGGKNGYGAKLANIYSKKFHIEVVDASRKLKYTQLFTNNMFDKEDPTITKLKSKKLKSYVKITFTPDYKRFGMDGLSRNVVGLLKKRVYDIAAYVNRKVKVYLNDELIKFDSFEDYINMFYSEPPESLVYEDVNQRWKVGVVYDPEPGYRHISYVNGICTFSGGSHVDHVVHQIVTKFAKKIKEKYKNLTVKSAQIKDNMTVFVSAVITDPAFSSQIKDNLKNKVATFGSRCDISDDFIKKLAKTGLMAEVVEFAKLKSLAGMKKSDGKKKASMKGMLKLNPAKYAGTNKSSKCRLILTEGDSAKKYAVDGTAIIGNDYYGVFPLRGKLLNVREAGVEKLKKNKEIMNIKKIMGLKHGVVYTDIKQLRYGGIIILTDQDVDGTHIKGLIMNFIHYFWPELMATDGFVQSMITPIVKVFKKSDRLKKNPKIFYTLQDFEKWKSTIKNINLWKTKYYKGLGTSDTEEAVECFLEFDKRLITYVWDDVVAQSLTESDEAEASSTRCIDAMHLAFSSENADKRKVWLKNYDKNNIIESGATNISFDRFVNSDLIHFSNYDTERSIPSIFDGFKPSQRKIIYAAFKRRPSLATNEMRVSQFAGYVSAEAAYHHGEDSLNGAIIKMAQNFIGSNNINLFMPKGNFGDRSMGGKNAAQPRYPHVQLQSITQMIFRREDDAVLDYTYDDGQPVEPVSYAPLIPMELINGVKGIGTGFSTAIPCFNPLDVMDNVKRLLKNKPLKLIAPWYRNFTGKIEKIDSTTYRTYGKFNTTKSDEIVITELPIGLWTENYKKVLDSFIPDDIKKIGKNHIIKKYHSESHNDTIKITVTFLSGRVLKDIFLSDGGIIKKFKLHSNLNLSNMHLYHADRKIKKYKTVNDIFIDHYTYRINIYNKRKAYLLKKLKNEIDILSWKAKFIKYVIEDKILFKIKKKPRKKTEIIADLVKYKFPKLSRKPFDEDKNKSYDYITSLNIFSLTEEEYNKLRKERDRKLDEYKVYKKITVENMWLTELNQLEKEYHKWCKFEKAREIANAKKVAKAKKTRDKMTKKRRR